MFYKLHIIHFRLSVSFTLYIIAGASAQCTAVCILVIRADDG